MNFRRPSAHLRRAPSWRKSGDESHWESFLSDGQSAPRVSHPPRPPRPQSAIEGGHLDSWLEHLQRIQSDLQRTPVHDHVPAFNDRTTSMPAINKDTSRRTWNPSFSRPSSSCGTPSLYESSLGSQESLHAGVFSRPERRGSLERVHIMQAPKKEQAQLSSIAPVRIGWLPIQRRVVAADARKQNQYLDHSPNQVRLKQPITPTFQKIRATSIKHQDGEVERSHSGASAWGAKTWQTPDQGLHVIKQVQEKRSAPANTGDQPGSWPALRRGWNTNRVSAFPRDCPSTETSSDRIGKSPVLKTTGTEHLKQIPLHQLTAEDFCKPPSLPQGTSDKEKYTSCSPLHRTCGVQPIRATAPLNSSSSVTTIVPQSKASFSSITISSRKVCRSASLPGSGTCRNPSQSRESPSPPTQTDKSMDPNSSQVTLQRKATIVKVTEQRMVSTSVPGTKNASPASQASDTVVQRRKATIIKVTEHRESYSPSKVGIRNPQYRHSYTEGLFKENNMLSQGNHSQHNASPSDPHPDWKKGPNSPQRPESATSDQDGTLHRSTLCLFVNNAPTIEAAPSEVPRRAVGQRSDRPQRPQSCYGNVFGHSAQSKENVTQPVARKLSFELPQGTKMDPASSGSIFNSPRTGAKDAGQLEAETFQPNGSRKDERCPPENSARRASPCLTLIKAPDPDSNQSPEEVLALNAAAIIANIKLQRQLSKKKTPNGKPEKDSTASPQGTAVTDDGKWVKPKPDPSPVQQQEQPSAAHVPLSPDPKRPQETISLQEALKRSRPDFISRSQGRLRELERRAQERRELAGSGSLRSDAASRPRRAPSARSTPLNDNLSKPRDKAITGKEAPLRSKHMPADVKRKKEEEKKREVFLSNKQRVELFKKKLLNQILHRSSS